MKGRWRWTIVALVVVLAISGSLLESDGREESLTSFGVSRFGYKALHDLLSELGLPVHRSYAAPQDLPAGATVWWLNATQPASEVNSGPCGLLTDDKESAGPWHGSDWLAAGGTAVVFPDLGSRGACESIAGFKLPPHRKIDEDGNPLDRKVERKRRFARNPLRFTVTGVGEERALRTYALYSFDGSGDWAPAAWIKDQPFILERTVGSGRLIVVADGGVLQNNWLSVSDAAPFALDLVRRYGVPIFDENAHGFRPSQDVIGYLVRSPAGWVLAGLCLLGLLIIWRGALVPGRPLDVMQPMSPSLDSYVDSLAGWYARSADYGRIAERYRQYALARLRRYLHLPAEIPVHALAERLESKARFTASMRATLLQPAAAASRDELSAAVAALDAVILAGATSKEVRP